jgi:hypothetical protein
MKRREFITLLGGEKAGRHNSGRQELSYTAATLSKFLGGEKAGWQNHFWTSRNGLHSRQATDLRPAQLSAR